MLQLSLASFERLVRRALDELPDEFAARVENLSVVVEEEPGLEDLEEVGLRPDEADELFGLYHGTPLVDRGSSYVGLPDRIVIYRGPILRACRSPREVVREVRNTVIHELGHHFGLSDDEMPY